MQIGLTRKLADYAKINLAPADATLHPLYSWSANLLTINRRKTIVVMNDASRFAFILNGVKAVGVKKLDKLILHGIRQLMLSEGITHEITELYLSEGSAGSPPGIAYAKTSSRKAVAALNIVCANLEFLSGRETDVFPSEIQAAQLNRIIFRGEGQYNAPYDLFVAQLKERYGEPVFQTEAVELTVTLDLDGSDAVRRLVVPTFFTFAELHKVIQTVFNWQNYHLHEFVLSQDAYGRPVETIAPPDDEREDAETCRPEIDVRLSEMFCAGKPSRKDAILYVYDFGDNWQHRIRCERIIDNYNGNYALCTHMEGNAPPEDVGGPGGFHDMLEILKNEDHPEYGDTKAWVEGMRWRPLAEGDLEKRNRALARRDYGHYSY